MSKTMTTCKPYKDQEPITFISIIIIRICTQPPVFKNKENIHTGLYLIDLIF